MSRSGAQSRKFSSRWFRMYDEVVDDPKIQTLGDKLGFFWLNCLCLASKNRGYLPAVTDIAWKLRKKDAEVSAMIAKLYERGLLEQEGDTFSPHNWGERQYASDRSTERVREFRRRQKETPTETLLQPSQAVTGNGGETLQERYETATVTAPEQSRTEQSIYIEPSVSLGDSRRVHNPDKADQKRVEKAWVWLRENWPGEVNDFIDYRLFLSVVETNSDLDALRDNLPLWRLTKRWRTGFFPSMENFLSKRIFRVIPKPDVADENGNELDYPEFASQ